MRILHISTRLILGGSQENTILSCEGQARLGHEVHLAFGPIFGPEGSMLGRVQAFNERHPESRIHTHEVPSLVREVSPLKDLRGLRELRALIERIKPDIVHTHSSKAGVLGRWAAWDAVGRAANPSIPANWSKDFVPPKSDSRPGIVHTIHGPPWMPAEGPPHRRALISLKNTLYARAERFAARKCDRIVSVADAMTEQFLARDIGKPSQYVTVRSGMETAPFLHASPGEDRASVRDRLGLRDDDFVVGIVARLAEHKGHDDLIDALAPLMRRNAALRMLWVGDGWWRDRLEQRLVDEGLESQTVRTGMVDQSKIPGLMRAMDVLAHPSYREGLPRTVPQAMLAGTAVVATDTDGTREAVMPPSASAGEMNGVLVPVADPQALRDAVQWTIDHPELRAEMIERARTMCADMFSAERMVDELERVYAAATEMKG